MNNKLTEILDHKRTEVQQRKSERPFNTLVDAVADCPAVLDFSEALRSPDGIACIAEIKKASPSKGVITNDFLPTKIAREYKEGGANAISVLTDEKFFQGHPDYVAAAKTASALPILRKDFVVDEYQLYEARIIGADAVLLIVAALPDRQLRSFLATADDLGLSVLTECHSKNEVERAIDAGAEIIGVNNRDLQTFTVNVDLSLMLKNFIPNHCITVSESGIRHHSMVQRLEQAGFDAVLVGEQFMVQSDRRKALQDLMRRER